MALYLTEFFPLGFPTDGLAPAVWQGGETEALARLDKHLERKVTPKMKWQFLQAVAPDKKC